MKFEQEGVNELVLLCSLFASVIARDEGSVDRSEVGSDFLGQAGRFRDKKRKGEDKITQRL